MQRDLYAGHLLYLLGVGVASASSISGEGWSFILMCGVDSFLLLGEEGFLSFSSACYLCIIQGV